MTQVAMVAVCRKYAIITELYKLDIFPTLGSLLKEQSVRDSKRGGGGVGGLATREKARFFHVLNNSVQEHE